MRREISFQTKGQLLSQPRARPSFHVLRRSWILTEDELDHCPTMINTSRTIDKRSDWRWEGRHALWCSEGNFSDSVAAFHGLSDSSRTSQPENRGIRLPLVVGFGYALCLGFLFGLVGCFVLFVVLVFLKKIRDGAGSYLGRGTEGSPGHTCSSYGDKRIFFEVGLLLWVLLETTLVAEYCSFAKTPPPLRILALSLIIRISEPQGRFPLNIQNDSRKPLSALSCL